MSLFPAYAQESTNKCSKVEVMEVVDMSPRLEAELLASDEEAPPAAPAPPPPPAVSEPFYLDAKSDYANLRVSTLYYPGRPQYSVGEAVNAGPGVGSRKRARRYYETKGAGAGAGEDEFNSEVGARVAAFQQMLHDNPHDLDLWFKFIDFQLVCVGAEAALESASRARAVRPHCRALRRLHHRLARALHPLDDAHTLGRVSGCEWARLVGAAGRAGPGRAASAAALAARHAPPAFYPHLLYAYGCTVRTAGLWEVLVQLAELVGAANLPPHAAFPPKPQPHDALAEERLLQQEDQVIASGLPLEARWVRVERLRASVHWRPAGAGVAVAGDPQRVPNAAALGPLLQPTRSTGALLVQLLRLAKVPMFPCAAYVYAACEPCPWDESGEALLAVGRARRRLAHTPPRAAATLMALLVDPPHYFTPHTGFSSWVESLWEVACSESLALRCWRLRWLHSLLLLCDTQTEAGAAEARRLRRVSRATAAAGAPSPVALALAARIEHCAGQAGGARAGVRTARAALRDRSLPVEHRLYAARLAHEILGAEGGGVWAVACAVLGRELPCDADLVTSPPPHLLADALHTAEEECRKIEQGDQGDDGDDDDDDILHEEAWWRALEGSMLPGGGGARAGAAWALALEAAARAHDPSVDPQRVLLAATLDNPSDKWMYVRGAAWAGGAPDALLRRGLRLHALPAELADAD